MLVQLLTQAAQTQAKFTLTINRQRGDVEGNSKIDRYVIELKRDNDGVPFGIATVADDENVRLFQFLRK